MQYKSVKSISGLLSDKKRFNYFGKGNEFAFIFFKNIALTILTLGIYYPWAKVEILKYHYKSTELDNHSFDFQGTGKEVFKGFIKVYVLFVFIYAFLFYSFFKENELLSSISLGVFLLFTLLIIPFAIHGAIKYRATKSSWKNIRFSYLGNKMELFWKSIIGSLLTIFTLGLYGSWYSVDIRQYVVSHLRFGNLSFDFKGKGETLFWMNLKFFFLFFLTLGIYSFWYFKEVWSFYAENTEITQNGQKVNFKFNAQTGDVFELAIINFLLIVFTLGIATPWVTLRTFHFMFRFIEIEEGLHTNQIQKVNYEEFTDTTGEGFLSFLDLDLL